MHGYEYPLMWQWIGELVAMEWSSKDGGFRTSKLEAIVMQDRRKVVLRSVPVHGSIMLLHEILIHYCVTASKRSETGNTSGTTTIIPDLGIFLPWELNWYRRQAEWDDEL